MRIFCLGVSLIVMLPCIAFGADVDMFWTDTSSGTIYHNGNPVISGRTGPRGITGTGDKIYWAEPLTGGVYRANPDGSGIEQVAAGSTVYPWDVAVQGDTLYWTDRADAGHGGFLKRVDLTTGSAEVLYDYPTHGLALPEGLDVTGDWAYVISKDSHLLEKYWLGSGAPGEPAHQVIPVDPAFLGPGDVAVSAGTMLYYGDEYGDALWSSDLDGAGVTPLVAGMGDRWGVDTAGERIYWAESKIDTGPGVYSMKSDGSDVRQEYAVGRPYGLFVIPEPATALLLGFGGLILLRRRS